MFTGLVRDIGEIARVDAGAQDRTFIIRTQKLDLSREAIGASIACDGVCLTVTEKTADSFTVMASAETLSKTALGTWQKGTRINLEPSLRLGDEMGGHMVYGHVDGLATCTARVEEGQSVRFTFTVPTALMPYIASKGSVSLNGVSLTVNEVKGNSFGVNIIPHTLEMTNFAGVKIGDTLNFEIDMLARYVARMLEFSQSRAA